MSAGTFTKIWALLIFLILCSQIKKGTQPADYVVAQECVNGLAVYVTNQQDRIPMHDSTGNQIPC